MQPRAVKPPNKSHLNLENGDISLGARWLFVFNGAPQWQQKEEPENYLNFKSQKYILTYKYCISNKKKIEVKSTNVHIVPFEKNNTENISPVFSTEISQRFWRVSYF